VHPLYALLVQLAQLPLPALSELLAVMELELAPALLETPVSMRLSSPSRAPVAASVGAAATAVVVVVVVVMVAVLGKPPAHAMSLA
jgi:hypothetical protein